MYVKKQQQPPNIGIEYDRELFTKSHLNKITMPRIIWIINIIFSFQQEKRMKFAYSAYDMEMLFVPHDDNNHIAFIIIIRTYVNDSSRLISIFARGHQNSLCAWPETVCMCRLIPIQTESPALTPIQRAYHLQCISPSATLIGTQRGFLWIIFTHTHKISICIHTFQFIHTFYADNQTKTDGVKLMRTPHTYSGIQCVCVKKKKKWHVKQWIVVATHKYALRTQNHDCISNRTTVESCHR